MVLLTQAGLTNVTPALWGSTMQAFQFFIEDDRYSVSSLLVVQARSAERAKQLAQAELQQSPHYLSVEVYLDDERLFTVSAREPRVIESACERSKSGDYRTFSDGEGQLRAEDYEVEEAHASSVAIFVQGSPTDG
jgi:hypothetical protein